MGVFNNFPYANFHELNADWVIEQVRKVMDEWEEYKTDMDLWKLGVDDQLTEFQTWFDNLDVQDEVRTVMNELILSGEFIEITGPQIVSATEAWLAAHITPTTPAVDDTLSISGAAADAKVTGDRITEVKDGVDRIEKTILVEVTNNNVSFSEEHSSAYRTFQPCVFLKDSAYKIHIKVNSFSGIGSLNIQTATRPSATYIAETIKTNFIADGYEQDLYFTPTLDAEYLVFTFTNGTTASETNIDYVVNELMPVMDDINALENRTNEIVDDFEIENLGYLECDQIISTNTTFKFLYRNTGNHGAYRIKVELEDVANNVIIGFRCYNISGTAVNNWGNKTNLNTGDVVFMDMPEDQIDDTTNTIGFVYYAAGNDPQKFKITIYYLTEIENKSKESNQIVKRLMHGRMEYGAHQGAKAYAPIGTIAAYKKAGELGFDWAWIAQIKHSADDTLWVLHDDTLNSITDYTGTKTIFEMTDAEIMSCKSDIEGYNYKLADIPENDLRIPTLEEVIQICLNYGMKMYFRCDDLTQDYEVGNRTAAFVNLIKSYRITTNECAYSIYNNTARLNTLRNYLGNDIEISPFFSTSTTAQDYIDWLDNNNVINRSVIMAYSQIDLATVELLHRNNVKVYAYGGSGDLTRAELLNCSKLGVEAVQSGYWYWLPYESIN